MTIRKRVAKSTEPAKNALTWMPTAKRPQSFASFCSRYGFELTPAQRVLTSVSYDGTDPIDLDDADRAIARELFGPIHRVPEIARTIVVWKKGARIGGSRMAAMQLYRAANRVALPDLAPGESAFGPIVAPDLRLARQTLAYAYGAAKEDAREERIKIVREGADGFAFERHDGNVITIECLPATKGGSAVRGRTYVGAVMSEAAFFRDEQYAINDIEIYKAIAPRIVEGSQLTIESTPWAALGLLHEFVKGNYGDPSTCIAAVCPTTLLRPSMAKIVERERTRDPDNASREFDAVEMAAGSDAFFDPGACDEAMKMKRPARRADYYFAGGDIGLVSDSSALATIGVYGERMFLVDLFELRPKPGSPLKLSEVIHAFAERLRLFGLDAFVADGYSREAAREWAGREGILILPRPEGADSVAVSFTATRSAINEGLLGLIDHARLRAQFRAVVARPMSGGGMRITMPRRGGHGDLLSALTCAIARQQNAGSRMLDALRENMARQEAKLHERIHDEPEPPEEFLAWREKKRRTGTDNDD